jgi:REP element-mobilizing transposase RayT
MIRQVGKELGVQIVSGVLSREHVHILKSYILKSYLSIILEA